MDEILTEFQEYNGLYKCKVCGTAGFASLVDTHLHIMVHHTEIDQQLQETLDRGPEHFYLVYSYPNPIPYWKRSVRWEPLCWGMVEYRYGVGAKMVKVRRTNAKVWEGRLENVGAELIHRCGLKWHDACKPAVFHPITHWLRERIGRDGSGWVVVPHWEVETWVKKRIGKG